jgi:tRNA dimethylallyltransferase
MATGQRPPVNPLVAIIGATGTGKSQLAVDIAARLNGEIINCDAVQMYKGLPIITNKITPQEQQGIPHHLLDCIGLDEPAWTVAKFVPRALKIIEDIRSRGRLPILVGGTSYYVQSLLEKEAILPKEEDTNEQVLSILQQPTNVVLDKLREVDPVMADRWHPNDRRKIQRSLEIYLKTGNPASELYSEQKKKPESVELHQEDVHSHDHDMSATPTPSSLRFDALVFWVHADKDQLRSRLDARVEKMLQAGLLDEVNDMYHFKSQKESMGDMVDVTKGIWVSIGFKEFAKFRAVATINANDYSEKEKEKQLDALRKEAIIQTQSATRQYAKRQVRWIQVKFVNAMIRANATHRMFLLDGSDISQWNTTVSQPAQHIARKFLAGHVLPTAAEVCEAAVIMLTPPSKDLSHARHLWVKNTCEVCNVTSVTTEGWEKHVRSHRHRKLLAKKSKPKWPETQNYCGTDQGSSPPPLSDESPTLTSRHQLTTP